MEMPALEIGNGRGFGFFVGAMNDKHAKEVRPSDFDHVFGRRAKPDLVLVALFVRGTAQFARRLAGAVAGCFGVGANDSELLLVTG
jgi:hypothetical protein